MWTRTKKHTVLSSLRSEAERLNVKFKLTEDDLNIIRKSQNYKCNITGRDINPDGPNRDCGKVERIDPEEGFTFNNIQWVHKDVDIYKNHFDSIEYSEIYDKVKKANQPKIQKTEHVGWVDYFMGLAYCVSRKSHDSQTKNGAVLTAADNRILATGYNGFPPNMPDSILANMRDEKYKYMVHAEENCILHAGTALHTLNEPANLYLTMRPCFPCLKLILHSNIKNIFCPPLNIAKVSEEFTKHDLDFNLFLLSSDVNLICLKPDLSWLKILHHELTGSGVL